MPKVRFVAVLSLLCLLLAERSASETSLHGCDLSIRRHDAVSLAGLSIPNTTFIENRAVDGGRSIANATMATSVLCDGLFITFGLRAQNSPPESIDEWMTHRYLISDAITNTSASGHDVTLSLTLSAQPAVPSQLPLFTVVLFLVPPTEGCSPAASRASQMSTLLLQSVNVHQRAVFAELESLRFCVFTNTASVSIGTVTATTSAEDNSTTITVSESMSASVTSSGTSSVSDSATLTESVSASVSENRTLSDTESLSAATETESASDATRTESLRPASSAVNVTFLSVDDAHLPQALLLGDPFRPDRVWRNRTNSSDAFIVPGYRFLSPLKCNEDQTLCCALGQFNTSVHEYIQLMTLVRDPGVNTTGGIAFIVNSTRINYFSFPNVLPPMSGSVSIISGNTVNATSTALILVASVDDLALYEVGARNMTLRWRFIHSTCFAPLSYLQATVVGDTHFMRCSAIDGMRRFTIGQVTAGRYRLLQASDEIPSSATSDFVVLPYLNDVVVVLVAPPNWPMGQLVVVELSGFLNGEITSSTIPDSDLFADEVTLPAVYAFAQPPLLILAGGSTIAALDPMAGYATRWYATSGQNSILCSAQAPSAVVVVTGRELLIFATSSSGIPTAQLALPQTWTDHVAGVSSCQVVASTAGAFQGDGTLPYSVAIVNPSGGASLLCVLDRALCVVLGSSSQLLLTSGASYNAAMHTWVFSMGAQTILISETQVAAFADGGSTPIVGVVGVNTSDSYITPLILQPGAEGGQYPQLLAYDSTGRSLVQAALPFLGDEQTDAYQMDLFEAPTLSVGPSLFSLLIIDTGRVELLMWERFSTPSGSRSTLTFDVRCNHTSMLSNAATFPTVDGALNSASPSVGLACVSAQGQFVHFFVGRYDSEGRTEGQLFHFYVLVDNPHASAPTGKAILVPVEMSRVWIFWGDRAFLFSLDDPNGYEGPTLNRTLACSASSAATAAVALEAESTELGDGIFIVTPACLILMNGLSGTFLSESLLQLGSSGIRELDVPRLTIGLNSVIVSNPYCSAAEQHCVVEFRYTAAPLSLIPAGSLTFATLAANFSRAGSLGSNATSLMIQTGFSLWESRLVLSVATVTPDHTVPSLCVTSVLLATEARGIAWQRCISVANPQAVVVFDSDELMVLAPNNWGIVVLLPGESVVVLDPVSGTKLSNSSDVARLIVVQSVSAPSLKVFGNATAVITVRDPVSQSMTTAVVALPSLDIIAQLPLGISSTAASTLVTFMEPSLALAEVPDLWTFFPLGNVAHTGQSVLVLRTSLAKSLSAATLYTAFLHFASVPFQMSAALFALFGTIVALPPSWRPFTSASDWAGIVTNVTNQWAPTFALSTASFSSPLNGTFNDAGIPLLRNLPLTSLDLTGAGLSGTFPYASVGRTLESLILTKNQFGGLFQPAAVPPTIKELRIDSNVYWFPPRLVFDPSSQLRQLDISFNFGFVSDVDASFLVALPSSLTEFTADGCGISAYFPAMIIAVAKGGNHSFTHLDLSNNMLYGDVTMTTANSLPPTLQSLMLAFNSRLTGIPSLHLCVEVESCPSTSISVISLMGTGVFGTVRLWPVPPTLQSLVLQDCPGIFGDVDLRPLENSLTLAPVAMDASGAVRSARSLGTPLQIFLDFYGTKVQRFVSNTCPQLSMIALAWPTSPDTACLAYTASDLVPVDTYCNARYGVMMSSQQFDNFYRIMNASNIVATECQLAQDLLIRDPANDNRLLFTDRFVQAAGRCFDAANTPPTFNISANWTNSYDPATGTLIVSTPARTVRLDTATCRSWRVIGAYCAESFMEPGVWYKYNFTDSAVVVTRVSTVDTIPEESSCVFTSPMIVVNDSSIQFPRLYPFSLLLSATQDCFPSRGFSQFGSIQKQDDTTIVLIDLQMRSFPLHLQMCSNAAFNQQECDPLPPQPQNADSETCFDGFCGKVRTVTWTSCNGGNWHSGFNKVGSCRPLSEIVDQQLVRSNPQLQNNLQCQGNFESCLLSNASYPKNSTLCSLASGKYAGLLTCYLLHKLDPSLAILQLQQSLLCFGGNASQPSQKILDGTTIYAADCIGTIDEQFELCGLLALFSQPLQKISVRAQCSSRGRHVTLISCQTGSPIALLPTATCLGGGIDVQCSPCDPYIEPSAHALPYELLLLSTLKDIALVLFGAMVLDRRPIRSRTTKLLVNFLIRLMPYRGEEREEWRVRWYRRLNPRSVKEAEFRRCFDQLTKRAHGRLHSEPTAATLHEDLTRRISYLRRSTHLQAGGYTSHAVSGLSLNSESPISFDTPATSEAEESDRNSRSFADVGDDEFYDFFLRHVTLGRTQLLTQRSMEKDSVIEAFTRLYDAFARFVEHTAPIMHIGCEDDNDVDGEYVHVSVPMLPTNRLRRQPTEATMSRFSASDGADALLPNERNSFGSPGSPVSPRYQPLIYNDDVVEGLDLECALLVFNRRAEFREVVLEMTQLDKRFTPQAWMLSLQLFYAFIFLLICFAESGRDTYSRWDSFQAMYFRFVNSCSSVSLITNSLLRRIYRSKVDGWFDFFLVTSVLLLLPAVTHIVPGLLLYAWLTLPLIGVLIPMFVMLKRYEDRGTAVVNVQSVAIRVVTRFLLTFVITVVIQSAFNYAVLFYEREKLGLSYMSIVRYEFESRRWECFVIHSLKSLTAFMQILSAAI